MTVHERQLLIKLETRQISRDDFLMNFPIDIATDINYVKTEIRRAVETGDRNEVEMFIQLIWLSNNCDDYDKFTDTLNELLLIPEHRSHQVITKALQDIKSPSSIPFIRKALESNFDYLAYTCSDSDVIAKWFSWALYSIGTPDAIQVMRDFSNSPDEGIRTEMQYRLSNVENTGRYKDA